VTSTFPYRLSDNHIFFLSALGSLLLHGLLVAGLAYWPQSEIVKDETPTVQIMLLPTPQVPQTLQNPVPPMQSRATMQTVFPPPMPPTRTNFAQPPVPLPPSLKPPFTVIRAPMTPPALAKPILKDTHASQAMKTRNMMKMRVPTQAKPTSPFLSSVKTRQNAVNHVMPPIPIVRKERSASFSLLAPSPLATPPTLKATQPGHTRSSITRPTIISSSKPIYPRVARESGWEGTVIIRTFINTNGVPGEVKIRKTCGHPTLDQAAQEAVKNWKFQPAKDGNIPIAKWVDIPIKFNLHS